LNVAKAGFEEEVSLHVDEEKGGVPGWEGELIWLSWNAERCRKWLGRHDEEEEKWVSSST
jgi:hypothetical protein